ncbi:MAG TPA: efflux transporter outer membrane subunit [Burkholderiales bacterium]|nr:efflux transporter outer membrane subunit [Burkholderiales bacterium]
MKPRVALAVILGAALGGCMAGPDYRRPEVEVPAAYKEAGAWKPAQPNDAARRGQWWKVFGDPELDALVAQIEIGNQNLRLAEAQYRQARALVGQARAALFPSLSGSVSVVRGRSPASGPASTSHVLSLDASWEADLWGRVRREVEANVAGAEASAADLANARLSAQSELASDYFQLRVLDVERQLLDDTVSAYQKSLALTRNKYAVGVAGRIDLVEAQTQLMSTQAQAIDVGVARAQLEHAIAVLLGKPPAQFSLPRASIAIGMPAIPPGLPSELLERRPDIAGAERRVAAANAQIGVAKSAYFPDLTLSASGGFQSPSVADWISAPNRFWSIGPSLVQSIFDAGLRRAQTEQAIAAYDASVASYRQTVLGAFQEVEDNLAALRILEQEAAVQDEAARSARESVALTLNQYKAGTVDYLSVVTVQATQLSNERAAVVIYGQRLVAAVALIKALGGGWQAPAGR